MKRPPRSLQSRALAWLAQREHSRSELRRKLLRVARTQAGAAGEPGGDIGALADEVLSALESLGLLSDERFVDSRIRARSAGRGARRIEQELAQHGLAADPAALRHLRDSEEQRARQLWQRRFGVRAATPADLARQMRFLAGRGFGGDVVRRVVSGKADRPGEDGDPVG